MLRGDIVTVAAPGDFGKPRPALVIQSDLFSEHPMVTLCLLTGELRNLSLFRLTLEPALGNGLEKRSQVQIDKIMTVRREKIGRVIGRLSNQELLEIDRALALWIGLA
ncbi:MAG: type II toxin-antitoxin system PemK/MazF family toxin [Pseudomonadota bacterium]|nr:type II toxin-antitoxin system PemK/MazF family toxin [Pseudomonadota bacterium]